MAMLPANIKGFLSVIGFIDSAAKATLRLGYVTDSDDPFADARMKASNQPPVVVSQRDANQVIVVPDVQVPTNRVHLCPTDLACSLFAGLVPLASTTKTLGLSWQGAPIASFVIPARPPTVVLSWQPGATVDGPQQIRWQANHPDGAPLEFTLLYSHDGGTTFQRVSPSTSKTFDVLNFSELPGGTGKLRLLATDGGNTVVVESPSFNVPIKPAHAFVVTPIDGAQVSGSWVTLHGQGYYREEDVEEENDLEWTSSLDGALGTGPVIQRPLSTGRHAITLAVGRGVRRGTASVVIDVL